MSSDRQQDKHYIVLNNEVGESARRICFYGKKAYQVYHVVNKLFISNISSLSASQYQVCMFPMNWRTALPHLRNKPSESGTTQVHHLQALPQANHQPFRFYTFDKIDPMAVSHIDGCQPYRRLPRRQIAKQLNATTNPNSVVMA